MFQLELWVTRQQHRAAFDLSSICSNGLMLPIPAHVGRVATRSCSTRLPLHVFVVRPINGMFLDLSNYRGGLRWWVDRLARSHRHGLVGKVAGIDGRFPVSDNDHTVDQCPPLSSPSDKSAKIAEEPMGSSANPGPPTLNLCLKIRQVRRNRARTIAIIWSRRRATRQNTCYSMQFL